MRSCCFPVRHRCYYWYFGGIACLDGGAALDRARRNQAGILRRPPMTIAAAGLQSAILQHRLNAPAYVSGLALGYARFASRPSTPHI